MISIRLRAFMSPHCMSRRRCSNTEFRISIRLPRPLLIFLLLLFRLLQILALRQFLLRPLRNRVRPIRRPLPASRIVRERASLFRHVARSWLVHVLLLLGPCSEGCVRLGGGEDLAEGGACFWGRRHAVVVGCLLGGRVYVGAVVVCFYWLHAVGLGTLEVGVLGLRLLDLGSVAAWLLDLTEGWGVNCGHWGVNVVVVL